MSTNVEVCSRVRQVCSGQHHLPRDAAASGRKMPNSSESLDVAVHQPDQSVASTHGGVGWLAGKPDPESRRLTERCRTVPRSQEYYRLTLDMVILLSTSSRAMWQGRRPLDTLARFDNAVEMPWTSCRAARGAVQAEKQFRSPSDGAS